MSSNGNAKSRKRIEASLRAVGLIDPLVVYPLGDDYEILDGGLRYSIFLDMGVENGAVPGVEPAGGFSFGRDAKGGQT